MKTTFLITVVGLLMLTALPSQARPWSNLECGANWGPTKTSAPVYPRRAQQRGVEGYIVMGFSINADGKVEDIAVIDAKPESTFVRTAMRAVEGLEFPPCMQNGLATKQTDISVKFDFNLQ